MIAGYSTGAVPVNDGTVSPYGTSTQAQTVSGAPVSSGSDGSTIAGGALMFGYSEHLRTRAERHLHGGFSVAFGPGLSRRIAILLDEQHVQLPAGECGFVSDDLAFIGYIVYEIRHCRTGRSRRTRFCTARRARRY